MISSLCLLDNLLAPGGTFIFTAFNGLKVFNLLKLESDKNSVKWELHNDNGELIYSIKKRYRSKTFTGINQKIDVLLPFSDTYYTENLINTDILDEELSNKNIKLVESNSFKEYLCKYSEDKEYLHNRLTDIDMKYISLYSIYVYKKKSNRILKEKTGIPKFKLNKKYHESENNNKIKERLKTRKELE